MQITEEDRAEVRKLDAMTTDEVASLLKSLREDKARLDWLLSRCTVSTHSMGRKGQSYYTFAPFFTLRVQGGGREGIDDAMQNAEAIAAIERQFEDAARKT